MIKATLKTIIFSFRKVIIYQAKIVKTLIVFKKPKQTMMQTLRLSLNLEREAYVKLYTRATRKIKHCERVFPEITRSG